MVDLNGLAEATLRNATERMRNGANVSVETVRMLKHCATEVVEAMEAYSKLRYFPQLNANETDIIRKGFASELSDIICCVLIIAGKEGIDIEKAVLDCIEKNRKRAERTGDKL